MAEAATLRVNANRLVRRLQELGQIGALEGGGCSRLALTDADGRAGTWSPCGCATPAWTWPSTPSETWSGLAAGREDGRPVMCRIARRHGGHRGHLRRQPRRAGRPRSHRDAERRRRHHPPAPRRWPSSRTRKGRASPPTCWAAWCTPAAWRSRRRSTPSPSTGPVLGDELERIGYVGPTPCPAWLPHAFVELHIEQGPVLDAAGEAIGAVTGVQGISWQELVVSGQSNHAGTTPMAYRHDAGFVAASVATFVRRMVNEIGHAPGGGPWVASTSTLTWSTWWPTRATFTVDLRNTDDETAPERRDISSPATVCRDRRGRGRAGHRPRTGPLRAGRVRPPHDLARRADGPVVRVHGPPAAGRRRPRRPDAGPGVPGRHDLHPERRRHQPQPRRAHTAEHLEAGANILLRRCSYSSLKRPTSPRSRRPTRPGTAS